MSDDTDLVPTAAAPEVSEEAWSVDDDATAANAAVDEPRRHGPIVSLGLVALVVGIIGCVILLAGAFFTWHASKQSEPVHISAPTPTPVAAAPAPAPSVAPPTVTVTAQPPAVVQTKTPPVQHCDATCQAEASTPVPTTTDDALFLRILTKHGWTFTDHQRTAAIQAGHRACSSAASGLLGYQVGDQIANESGLAQRDADLFAAAATEAYCPQYLGR